MTHIETMQKYIELKNQLLAKAHEAKDFYSVLNEDDVNLRKFFKTANKAYCEAAAIVVNAEMELLRTMPDAELEEAHNTGLLKDWIEN